MTTLKTLFPSSSVLRLSAAARTTSPTSRPDFRGLLIALLTVALCSALAGCSAMTSVEPTAQGAALKGIVHGGQQPVIGATIQLIEPGTTGYGIAGSVIASTTTDGTGSFTIPSYTCPANSGLVYLLATGGNPGAGTNSSLAEAAVLGPCSGLTASTFVTITEVTTVAAAYTLAPFATVTPGSPGTTSIGTSSTNLLGLTNAAAAAKLLVSLSNGQAPGATSISGVILPTAQMNTLADILASCVNSGVGGVVSTGCSSLFTDATPPNGTAPTDTFQAALDIALNPGNNTSALYLLAKPSAPFQPTMPSAPGDFALGIQFNAGALGKGQPQGIDIDAQGNAWVSILGGGRSGVTSGLVELSPSGVVTPSSGDFLNTMDNPQAVAINSGGMVEVADYDLGIFEYAPPGATGSGFTSYLTPTPTGSVGPTGLAIDNNDGSTWIADYGNGTVTHISQTGVQMTGSPFTAGVEPWGIALNVSRDLFVDDSDSGSGSPGTSSAYTEYTPTGSGTYSAGTTTSTGAGLFPNDVAFDHTGNVWITVNTGPLVYSPSGSMISPAGGYTSNSDNVAGSIEIDGLGRAYVAANSFSSQTQPGSLLVFASNGTLISTNNSQYGYTANNTIMVDPFVPHGLALDASGNCWIAGNTPNVVTELIGIAAPVLTPLSVQLSTNQLGLRP